MRNDFPGHPAGPLSKRPDVNEIIELRESQVDKYIMAVLFLLPMFVLGLVMLFSDKGMELYAAGVIAICLGAFYLMFGSDDERPAVVRIRPDGLEFPRDNTPPLHWHDIDSIELGEMNVIGGGGAHDYLGIILRPGMNYPTRSGLSGKLTNMLGQWGFDICYAMQDFDRPIVHVIMEMRARLEASRMEMPQAPSGLPPIHPGAVSATSD